MDSQGTGGPHAGLCPAARRAAGPRWEASLPTPGGDAIGLRGIDFHVAGLRAMGAEVELSAGAIRATARSGLRGADILLPQPSVGATENLLLAAVLARGTTFIRNAAREPEIADLAACLGLMGALTASIRLFHIIRNCLQSAPEPHHAA